MIDIAGEFQAVRDANTRVDSILRWSDSMLFAVVPEVSAWSTGQQLYHIAEVNTVVGKSLIRLSQSEEDQDADRRASITGVSILATGFIPRGRGNTPARLQAPPDLSRSALQSAVTKSRSCLEDVETLLALLQSRKGRIQHPYFGYLRASQWVRFLNIHTAHHLKIVRDIERAHSTPSP